MLSKLLLSLSLLLAQAPASRGASLGIRGALNSSLKPLRLMKARSKHEGEAEVIYSDPLVSLSQHKGGRLYE